MTGDLRDLPARDASPEWQQGMRHPADWSEGKCPECGGPVVKTRGDKKFCQPACKRAFNNRMATYGSKMMPMLVRWWKARNCTPAQREALGLNEAFAEATHYLDTIMRYERARMRQIGFPGVPVPRQSEIPEPLGHRRRE